ncbi:hypothetical protein QJR26_07000 [Clostridium baratii]
MLSIGRKEIYEMIEYCKREEVGLCVKCPHSKMCNDATTEITEKGIRISLIPEQWEEKEIDIIEGLNK